MNLTASNAPRIETRPLPLTRGRQAQVHIILDGPCPAHVVEHPDGHAELYLRHRRHSDHDTVDEALRAAQNEAR